MPEGNKIVLFDFSGMSEAGAKVACRLIDVVEKAAGYIAPSREARDEADRAEMMLIKEIAENKNLDPFTRGALISDRRRIFKEYKNQTDILEKAIPFLKETAEPEDVEEDWFTFFMDKARLISDEDAQQTWAKILAQEVNEPSSVSKQLLLILSQMSKFTAEIFMKVASFCVDIRDESGELLYSVPVVFDFSSGENTKYKIRYGDIVLLESYNLITYSSDFTNSIALEKNQTVWYGEKKIEIPEIEELYIGGIFFTMAGNDLVNISGIQHDPQIYESICDWLKTMNKPKNTINLK